MQIVSNAIEVRESFEVKRSVGEAKRRTSNDLLVPDSTIQRYLRPSVDTPFPLEYAYCLLGDVTEKIVLDYGCGSGENSLLIAAHGGKVIGVDISPELIDLAEQRMDRHGYPGARFEIGSAHDLSVDDGSVDVVFGIAILHHLELRIAASEVYRVLKDGGRAIFLEPVRNSRFIWFVRNLIPYKSPDVSPYERPLTDVELAGFAENFTGFRCRAFSLPFVNLIETLGISNKLLHLAIRLDGKILTLFPFLNHFAAVRVFELTKPVDQTNSR